MHKLLMLAAMLAALGIAPQAAEARDHGFRHFSPQQGAKLHRPHHGAKVHQRGFFAGQPRHFKPRHFGHGGRLILRFGDRRGAAAKFAPVPHVKPRHFGHVGRGGLFLRFGDRAGIVASFGPVPRLKPRHFGLRHGPRGLVLEFADPRRFDPGHLSSFGHSFSGSKGRHPSVHSAAPSEALLTQLEAQGLRHVPRLLRERGRCPPFGLKRRNLRCAASVGRRPGAGAPGAIDKAVPG